MASILSRFKDIMSANVNAWLDGKEDPEKMIDQSLRNLREQLAEVKEQTAGVIANQKRDARALSDAEAEVAKLNTAARNAVAAGADDDARKLLQRKADIEGNLPNLRVNADASKKNAEQMRQMYEKLSSDIQTLETRRNTVKATMANAKAQEAVNRAVSNTKDSGSIEAFEKFEQKAQEMLDRAQAESELGGMPGLSDVAVLTSKWSGTGATDSAVEDELAKLKAELGK